MGKSLLDFSLLFAFRLFLTIRCIVPDYCSEPCFLYVQWGQHSISASAVCMPLCLGLLISPTSGLFNRSLLQSINTILNPHVGLLADKQCSHVLMHATVQLLCCCCTSFIKTFAWNAICTETVMSVWQIEWGQTNFITVSILRVLSWNL